MLKNWTVSLPSTTRSPWSAVSSVCLSLSLLCCEGVALNFARYFLYQPHQEEHAKSRTTLQNQQSGEVFLPSECQEARLSAVQFALPGESVTRSLLEVHKLGRDRNDPYACDFLSRWHSSEWNDHITNWTQDGGPRKEYLWSRRVTMGAKS